MFGAAIIVLRETLEAALVVGILLAAVGPMRQARRWIVGGIGAGLVGAGIVAVFAETIASALAGVGQEFFNATVLMIAVVMLAWHNVWMKTHGRELARDFQAAGQRVSSGNSPLSALLLVVALAVMREGSEVALFLYSIAIGGVEARSIFTGGVIGLVSGIALGALIYSGLARIPQRQLFSVTSWLLTFLAAGMASQAAGFLTQANVLPPLADPLWDTSRLLSERHPLGQLLHVLIGYIEKPTGVQMLFFTTVLVAMVAMISRTRLHKTIAPIAAAGLVVIGLLSSNSAHAAAHKIYSPIVEEGEYAIELRGHVDLDSDPALNRAQQYNLDFEHAPTSRWLTELVGEFKQAPGESLKTTALEWENILQLTEQGAHWLDVGVLVEYEHELVAEHDHLKLAALLEKSFAKQVIDFNFRAEHELGGEAETELDYAARWRWRKSQSFEPAIELYGQLGNVDHLGSFSTQQHLIGPGLLGKIPLKTGGKLRYEAAYLFAVSAAAPNSTLRLLLEYEF